MARASSLQLRLEAQLQQWQDREMRAVAQIEKSGVFCRVDEPLLARDASFTPPASAPLMPLVESRFLAEERERVGLVLFEWRAEALDGVSTDQVLVAGTREGFIPASLAYLTNPDQLKQVIKRARGRLIILPGTGLVDAEGNFSFVVIDYAHAENSFDDEDDEAGPILRVMQTSLASLRRLPSVLLYARPSKSQ